MKLPRRTANVLLLGLLSCSGGGGGDGEEDPMGPPPPAGQTLGSITTNVTTVNLGAGSSASITVTAYDVNSQVISNPASPTFTIVNSDIAEVDGAGTVLGLSEGSTQVTASLTMGSVTRTANISVTVTGALASDVDVVASSGDYIFTPGTVAVQQGGTVTWSFGSLEHTVTFSSAPGVPANISSGYGGSVSRTFGSAGNFSYVCTIHAGMSGKVIVR